MRDFALPGRSPVIAEHGMAATSHPLGTMTAIAVLREGGNAVDAAIAACATLCVVEPAMTGIGGDCFALVAEPDGTVHGLNGSGRAAQAADADWLRGLGHSSMPQTGALSVTVPGALRAWEALSVRFGTLGFDRLFADAIRYAEEGFAVHARVARDWPNYVAELAADEGGRLHYLRQGRAPRMGERMRQPALAGTLRRLAKDGAGAFYEGEIAAEIAATVKGKGGRLSEADLAACRADWVAPVSIAYAGHDVLEMPPNGQGITAQIMLNILDLVEARRHAPDSPERHHLLIEAARLAYSVRDHLVADPAAMTAPVERLLSREIAAALGARIDLKRRNADVSIPPLPGSDTVYLTVVDRDRRAVSFINSLYGGFGAKVVTPRSGVTLQNRGGCFSLVPGHPNEYGPGKRPMHTIIPAMATRGGRAAVSFGVMGGAYQAMGHAHVFSNLADDGMDPQMAVDQPRVFWGADGTVEVESGMSETVRRGLEARGHSVRAGGPFGGGQVIVIGDDGFLTAGSDPRKDGLALGW